MKRARSHSGIDSGLRAFLILVLAIVAGAACDSDSPTSPASGPFVLTFSLDASFQAVHGGQPISLVVLRTSDGTVIANGNATVSATQDPSYSFGPVPGLARGVDYEVHYWIETPTSAAGHWESAIPGPSIISGAWSSSRWPMTSTGERPTTLR